MSAPLKAESLGKRYGGVIAVEDISIQVASGEIVGIIGPNGSGKTTLLSMLAGFVVPTKGRIHLDGVDVTGRPPYADVRRQFSFTFQTPRLFDGMSVRENIALGARAKKAWEAKLTPRRIDELISALALDKVADNSTYALSGGQRKLVEIARAFASDPTVVLLDEPTAGVSPALHDIISRNLKSAASRGIAIAVVSHDLPWCFEFANRVVAVEAGKVLTEGSAEEVQKNPCLLDAYLA